MRARRLATLTSLLLTAALLYALPGLTNALCAQSRVGEGLRPTRARTLTVWVLSDGVEDARTIGRLAADFERAQAGVRVFLRRVDASELQAPDAVRPDVALYGVGAVMEPEKVFVPLSDAPESGAGMSGGKRYAATLWYEPNVLCVPYAWARGDAAPAPARDSFFDLETPAPEAAATRLLAAAELPWQKLLEPGALSPPEGVAWQQLLATCPASIRPELIASLQTDAAPQQQAARVKTLAACLYDESSLFYPLAPAASSRARFLSLCRDSADARAFAAFMLSAEAADAALENGLMPSPAPTEVADPLRAALCELGRAGALVPNAFAHAAQELSALCRDAFMRAEDPMQTLIRLR